MSKENLPEKINPFRFAEAGAQLEGVLLVKDMPRLCTSLASDEGQVHLNARFGIDEQGTPYVRGEIEAKLTLQCQRCMETFVYDIMTGFLSGIVRSEEEAKQLAEVYEPVLAEENALIIRDLIEDELIVSLPIVPMHNPKDCKIELPKMVLGSDEQSEVSDNNPFKVIEILRVKRDKSRDQK